MFWYCRGNTILAFSAILADLLEMSEWSAFDIFDNSSRFAILVDLLVMPGMEKDSSLLIVRGDKALV